MAMQTTEQFVTGLDAAWVHKRLREAAQQMHWPTREELVDYFLDAPASGEDRRLIAAHLRDCAACQAVVTDLERGAARLEREDPLGEPAGMRTPAGTPWLAAVRALLRPAAWPAWSLAATVAVGLFALGVLVRPALWPEGAPQGAALTAQIVKPGLPRQPDGSVVLGIGRTTARPEAVALLQTALAAYDAADFADRALPVLTQAVAADPSFEQARFWLGVCYLLTDKTTAALPQLEEAVRLAPGNVTYRHYLVWGYLKAGDGRKALAAQTQLLEQGAPGAK